ncbi:MAG: BACON domain-containing protein, partial [Bryobacteraceae bacterium]
LAYSTYLGGSTVDNAWEIAVDRSGAAYVAGNTQGSFPIANAPQPGYGGGISDAFVAKFSPSGQRSYSTYLGGPFTDAGLGIAVDATGAAYVTGWTTGGFPTVNPGQPNYGGFQDAFVAKFSADGTISSATLTGVSPDSALAGGLSYTLYVEGGGFHLGATVLWNGIAISTGCCTATVPANLIANPGAALVTVANPGENPSNAVVVTITAAPTKPTIVSAAPGYGGALSTGGLCCASVIVAGSNLQPGAVIIWNGINLPSSFNSGTFVGLPTLAQLQTAGPVALTVLNPGGVPSDPLNFTVPSPVLSNLVPSTTTEGIGFTLTVNGSGMSASGAEIRMGGPGGFWNINTTFISSSQVQGSVPGAAIPTPGTYQVWVNTAAPGGGTGPGNYPSNQLALTVGPANCTYSLSSPGATFGAAATSGSVNVISPALCPWIATSPADWVVITGGSSGSGNGTVSYNVLANPTSAQRTAILTIAGIPYTITQAGQGCQFSLTPGSVSAPAQGLSGSFGIGATPGDCAWTAISDVAWITVTGGSSGLGNGTVSFTVAANGTSAERSGTITAAGQAFTVLQAASPIITFTTVPAGLTMNIGGTTITAPQSLPRIPGTTLSVSVASPQAGATGTQYVYGSWSDGGAQSHTITIPANAATYTANFTTQYLLTTAVIPAGSGTVTGGGYHNSGATVPVTATANTGFQFANWSGDLSGSDNPQNLPMTGPRNVTANFTGVCLYSITPPSASYGTSASAGSVAVTASAGCAWTATSPVPWVRITGGATGTGSGTVTYTVDANSVADPRNTALTIAGLQFPVSQAGQGCLFALTPATVNAGAAGASGNFVVGLSGSDCTWKAVSDVSWIRVTGGTPGTGSGPVNYTVDANPSAIGRPGTISVGPLNSTAPAKFTVIQAGTACTYSLGQASQSFTSASGNGSVSVTSPGGCGWQATTTYNWITITGGAIGAGNGTVSYAVAPNAGTTRRTGTITIAGQSYSVTQEPPTVALGCSAAMTTVPQVASDGRTELLGEMTVSCVGLTSAVVTDVVLTLNTSISNRLSQGLTDAALTVNGAAGQNGEVAGYNTINWPGVTMGPGPVTLRISGIRADASLLPAAANLQPAPITGRLALNAVVAIPIVGGTQTMANALPSLIFQKGATTGSGARPLIALRYQEVTAGALKGDLTRTRLVVTGVPSGVQVFAPVYPGEGANRAQLYDADSKGFGGGPVTGSAQPEGIYEQLTVNSGVAYATWVAAAVDDSRLETLTFPLLLVNPTGTDLSPVQVAGSGAPVSAVSGASATEPIPRYRDFSVAQKLVNLRLSTTVFAGKAPPSKPQSVAMRAVGGRALFQAGSTVTFVSTVVNDTLDQSQNATNVVIRGSLPSGLILVGCTSTPGATVICAQDGVEVTYGQLGAGESRTVTIEATVGTGLADGTVLNQRASAQSDEVTADVTTATATSSIAVSAPRIIRPEAVSGLPTNPTGSPQTFTFTGRDADGSFDISRMYFLVSANSPAAANTCQGYFDHATKGLYLFDNALTVPPAGPLALGEARTLQNSQCVIDGSVSSLVSQTDTDVVIRVGIGLKGSYAATTRNVYLYVDDLEGNNSGWVRTGMWTAPPPVPPEVVPPSPVPLLTGSPQNVTLTGRDANGYTTIDRMYFQVYSSPTIPVNSCHGYYDAASDGLYLYNDALTTVLGPLKPGTSGTLQNSQCTINGSASAVTSPNATDLRVTLGIALTAAYLTTSPKVYLLVRDYSGLFTSWAQVAGWGSQIPPVVVAPNPITPLTGASVIVSLVGRDGNGYSDINKIYFQVYNSAAIPINTCHGFYDRASDRLYLYNDALTVLLGPLTPGSSGTLQNSQCTINGSTSGGVSGSGDDLRVNLGITLSSAYLATSPAVHLILKDNFDLVSPWAPIAEWGVGPPVPPSVVVPNPLTALAGSPVVLSLVGRDGNKHTDINRMYFQVYSSATIPVNTCHGYYDRATDRFYLYNDALTALLGPLTPGSSGTLQNSQCTINGGTSGVVFASGNNLSVNVGISLSAGYLAASPKVYLIVSDNTGLNSGWSQIAQWGGPPLAPTVVVPNPVTALAGSSAVLSLVARDANGHTDINRMYFQVYTSTAIPVSSCHGFYDRASSRFYLYNDALTALLGPLAPGSSETLQNSQCTISGSTSGIVSASGNDLIVSLGITLSTGYLAASPKVYVIVSDNAGLNSGWSQIAQWGNGPLPPSVVVPNPLTALAGSSVVLSLVGRDGNGHADINRMYFQVYNSATIPVNSCHGFYDRASDRFYLYNDALTVLLGPLRPGSSGTLQNSQCTISGNTSGIVSAIGNDLTVSLGISLSPAYLAVSPKVYLVVSDTAGLNSGWSQIAQWGGGDPVPPSVVVPNPMTSLAGSPVTLSLTGRDGNGFADINKMYFQVYSSATIPVNTCHGFYDRASDRLYLYNDALTALLGPLAPGSSGTLQNSQCAINGSTSGIVSASGTDLSFRLGISLSAGYLAASPKVYLLVADNAGLNSGWSQIAQWGALVQTPPSAVVPNPVTPLAGSPVTLSLTGRDGNGYADINKMYFQVYSSATIPVNTCHGFYDRASDRLYLYNDALTVLLGPLTPGSSGTLQNSQCILNGATSGIVSASGNDLSLRLGISLSAGYLATSPKVYLLVSDNAGLNGGWSQIAQWSGTTSSLPLVAPDPPTPLASTPIF